MFHPPGSCTVHAVQGRTVDGRLIIHEAPHLYADIHWLYTAASRAAGLSNVRVVNDVHLTVSNMTCLKKKKKLKNVSCEYDRVNG